MIELTYISSATAEFDESELVELLKISHNNNEALGITGLLIYNGRGTFLQFIEGEDKFVHHLYEKIKEDSRHTRVTCLGSKKISERTYPDWKMGFRNLSHTSAGKLKGYSDFMNNDNSEGLAKYSDFANVVFSHFKESSQELIF